jgi:hypothetical protein
MQSLGSYYWFPVTLFFSSKYPIYFYFPVHKNWYTTPSIVYGSSVAYSAKLILQKQQFIQISEQIRIMNVPKNFRYLSQRGTVLNSRYRRLPVLQPVPNLIPQRRLVVPRSYLYVVLLHPSWWVLRQWNTPLCLQPIIITVFTIISLQKFTIWLHGCNISIK